VQDIEVFVVVLSCNVHQVMHVYFLLCCKIVNGFSYVIQYFGNFPLYITVGMTVNVKFRSVIQLL